MITLGAVASAHGVHGQFKVKPFTVIPSDVAAYGPVRLEDGRTLQLNVKSVAKNIVICEAEGITNRGMAETLRGQTLSVDRAALPKLDTTQAYHVDLIGLDVRDTTGQKLGVLVGLYNFGAGEIIEVSAANSSTTEFYPFYPPFLVELDLQAGQIILAAQTSLDNEGSKERLGGND